MKYTGNYNLKKPEGSDVVNINDLNENADKIDSELAKRVDKVTGKGLSTNDYSNAEKAEVAKVKNKAEKSVVDAHLADNVKHITSTERTNWNGKQNALPVENRRKITFGTTDPTGGVNGDIYFQYE